VRFALRYLFASARHEPRRVLFVLLGLVLAIATFSSVRLTNKVALESFEKTARFMRGSSAFSVSSAGERVGIEYLFLLQQLPPVERVAARASRWGTVKDAKNTKAAGALQLLAIDLVQADDFEYFSRQPGFISGDNFLDLLAGKAMLVTQELYELLNSGAELFLDGKIFPAQDYAWLPLLTGEGLLIVVDIGLFLELDKDVNAFDLLLKKDVANEQARKELEQYLGPSFLIEDSAQMADRINILTRALRINLHYMASIALFVALLVVYHVMSFLAVRRRQDFSLLRSIGASSSQVRGILVLEAALLGLSAGALGFLLGYVLADFVSKDVIATIEALYAQVVPGELGFSWQIFAETLLLSLLITVLSVWPVWREALERIKPPAQAALSAGSSWRMQLVLIIPGILGFVLIMLLSQIELIQKFTGLGLFLALLISVAVLLFVPATFAVGLKVLRPLSERLRSVSLLLASDHLQSSEKRAFITISSVALALGMFIGITTMISSFRSSVSNWILDTSDADLYISLPSPYQNRFTAELPQELIDYVKNSPQVSEGTFSVVEPFRYGAADIFIRSYKALGAEQGAAPEVCEVKISQSFASRFGVKQGDFIELQSGAAVGSSFRVEETVADYSSERGTVFLSPECFLALRGNFAWQAVSLKFKPGVVSGSFGAKMLGDFSELALNIRDGDGLRQEVFKTFDATFKITYALQTISLILVTFIIMNTLVILLYERRHEFATLRALGAPFGVLLKLAVTEGLLLTFFALIFSLLLGTALSLFLIYVINVAYFGWSVSFEFSWNLVLVTFSLTLLLVFVLTLLLVRGGLKKNMQEALRYE